MNHLLTKDPDIYISDEALKCAKVFFDETSRRNPGENYILTASWCDHSRSLAPQFTEGFDDLKKELSQEDFSRELKRRADAHAEPIPPHVMLGVAKQSDYQSSDLVSLFGMSILTEKATFSDLVAQNDLISLSARAGRVRLVLSSREKSD